MRELLRLNVSINKIRELPRGFGNFSSLRWLDVSGNHLESLPANIALLDNLSHLYASDNKLKALPSGMAQMKGLMVLVVNGNELTELPHELASLGKLLEIGISYNKFAEVPALLLGGRLPNLKHVDLAGNPMQKQLLKKFDKMKSMEDKIEYLRGGQYRHDMEEWTGKGKGKK